MRDFPFFTTENGVGSLVLREIPYRGIAYVTIRDSSFPTEFLMECLEFCRMAGAERVYACGHACVQKYPFYTSVVRMSADVSQLDDTDACLFPVTQQTVSQWRQIYNRRMEGVDNAAYMPQKEENALLAKGNGYFVHRNGQLLGIGIASEDQIACIASVKPGCGRDTLLALTHALSSDRVFLEVASTNLRAIELYERLGFIQTAELSKWYKIL